MSKKSETSLEESLIVMDIADRLRRHDKQMDVVTDLESSRYALKDRIRGFYAKQGHDVDDQIIETAIEQRINQRLVHKPLKGVQSQMADYALTLSKSGYRIAVAGVVAAGCIAGLGWGLLDLLLVLV